MFANVYRKIQKFAAGGYILYAVLAILCYYVITIYYFFSHFFIVLKVLPFIVCLLNIS